VTFLKAILTLTVFLAVAPSAHASASVLPLNTFVSVGHQGHQIQSGKRLLRQEFESNGNEFRLQIEKSFTIPEGVEIPAIYVPYMGGMTTAFLNGEKIYFSGFRDRSIEGTVLPISPSKGANKITFEFTCRQTTFCGFWRGVPIIGEYLELNDLRDREALTEGILPLLGSLILLITGATLMLLSFGLRKERTPNQYLAFFLISWGAFFFSYSGYIRIYSGFVAAIIHFPIRSVTAVGLLFFIDSYFGSLLRRSLKFGLAFCMISGIAYQCYLGYSGASLSTLKISSVLNLLAFTPIFFVPYSRINGLRKIALVLGYIATVGQMRDSAMLFLGGTLFGSETMYLNKITLPPFVLFAFFDHLFKYVALTLKDRLLKTQSTLLNIFSIRAGEVFVREELDSLFGFFSKRLKSSEERVLTLPVIRHEVRRMEVSAPVSRDAPIRKTDSQLAVLNQIHNANLIRIQESELRIATEKKISGLIKQLDPNLFEYVQNNLSNFSAITSDLSVERGIVFFDQKGYTSMLENLCEESAYSLAEIVNRWVSTCTAKYAARIRNFNGDAYTLELYPLLNETPEKLASRTCSLVWELSQSIDQLNHELFKAGFEPIAFRFGAHVGKASGVKLDFISPGLSNLVGDSVNIAARLQTLAKAGTVYVSGDLSNDVEDQFVFRKVPRSYVKGRLREIEVYELIGRVLSDPEAVSA